MAADNLKVELQNAGIPWILGVWSSGFSLLRDHSVAIVRINCIGVVLGKDDGTVESAPILTTSSTLPRTRSTPDGAPFRGYPRGSAMRPPQLDAAFNAG
jgi:hypothetical protein